MADSYTTTSSLGLDQAAYDKAAYYSLRDELFYDAVADVQPTSQTDVGSSVIFRFFTDLAAAVTPLSEAVDVDAVAMADSTVTLTLAEYGNAVISTRLARGTAYIPFNPVAANVIGFNAGVSINTLAGNVLKAGTNVRYATGGATTPTSRTTVETDDILTAHDVRRARADLVGANVQRINGSYVSFIHPDVAIDLREETGADGWLQPANYSAAERRWNGDIGMFEGFRFIETPTGFVFVNASNGSGAGGNIDVYRTVFLGQQALAKTWSRTESGPMPQVRPSPVTDKLWRFVPIGWYWLGAYGIFRQAAVRAVESTSSIANNAS